MEFSWWRTGSRSSRNGLEAGPGQHVVALFNYEGEVVSTKISALNKNDQDWRLIKKEIELMDIGVSVPCDGAGNCAFEKKISDHTVKFSFSKKNADGAS